MTYCVLALASQCDGSTGEEECKLQESHCFNAFDLVQLRD